MKIITLNGNPDKDRPQFDTYLKDLTRKLTSDGYTADVLILRELNAEYCISCWSCWVKTPRRGVSFSVNFTMFNCAVLR